MGFLKRIYRGFFWGFFGGTIRIKEYTLNYSRTWFKVHFISGILEDRPGTLSRLFGCPPGKHVWRFLFSGLGLRSKLHKFLLEGLGFRGVLEEILRLQSPEP